MVIRASVTRRGNALSVRAPGGSSAGWSGEVAEPPSGGSPARPVMVSRPAKDGSCGRQDIVGQYDCRPVIGHLNTLAYTRSSMARNDWQTVYWRSSCMVKKFTELTCSMSPLFITTIGHVALVPFDRVGRRRSSWCMRPLDLGTHLHSCASGWTAKVEQKDRGLRTCDGPPYYIVDRQTVGPDGDRGSYRYWRLPQPCIHLISS
jgi:hypothetical protein